MAQRLSDGGSASLDVVERLVAAFNARDTRALAEVFHEQVELWPTDEYVPAGMSYHGRQGMQSLLDEGLPGLPGVQIELRDFDEFGERALASIKLKLADQTRDSFWVYTFEEGLVLRAEQYPDYDSARAAAEHHQLTPRERQVFQLLARGLTGPEIAEELTLSAETVRTHVQNGVDRLGASTRVQAVALAITRGEIVA